MCFDNTEKQILHYETIKHQLSTGDTISDLQC